MPSATAEVKKKIKSLLTADAEGASRIRTGRGRRRRASWRDEPLWRPWHRATRFLGAVGRRRAPRCSRRKKNLGARHPFQPSACSGAVERSKKKQKETRPALPQRTASSASSARVGAPSHAPYLWTHVPIYRLISVFIDSYPYL